MWIRIWIRIRTRNTGAEATFFSSSQAMVGKAAEACPTLLSPGSAPLSELRELAETKAAARLPPDFAKNLVAATLGVELTNKVRFCITTKDTRSL